MGLVLWELKHFQEVLKKSFSMIYQVKTINTLKIFLKNIPNDNYEIHQTDIFKYSESLIENCNIIYVDPPYNYDFNLFKINILPKLSKNCLVIYESNQKYI